MCLAATSRISFFETKAGFFLISSPYQVCWRIFWYNPRPQGINGHKYTFEFFRPKTTCFCMEPKGSLKTTFPVRESGCFSRSGHSPTYRRVTQKWSDVPDLPFIWLFKILQRDQLHPKISCFFFLQWFFSYFKFLWKCFRLISKV